MAILNYLKENKDISFAEKPLNVLDIALITEISYMNFECFLPLPDELISLDYFKDDLKTLVDPSLFVKKNTILFNELTTSKRFSDLKFGEFVFDVSEEGRYCSMLITVGDYKFIVYRGTDLTIAGWVEDFNMAIFGTVISHKLGLEYTKKIMDKYDGNFILSGHSKGGNIAIYSAYYLEDKYYDRVIDVYDFDGPGFKDNITITPRYEYILPKIKRFTPQNDIIGTCMNTSTPYVVRSTSVSIFQHDMYSWNTKNDDFYYLKRSLYKSKAFGESISLWLDSMTHEEKIELLDIIYNIFKKAEIESVNQFKQNIFSAVNAILKAYFHEDKARRHFVNHFLLLFTKLYIKSNLGILKKKDETDLKKKRKKKNNKVNLIDEKNIPIENEFNCDIIASKEA